MRGPAYQDIRYKPAVAEPAVADGAAVAGEPIHGGGEAFNPVHHGASVPPQPRGSGVEEHEGEKKVNVMKFY